jgi:MinD superfamily P-loop ATPase
MKRILIISGKGGTGKTTVTSCLADLAAREKNIILADADVDAANLELLLEPKQTSCTAFVAGKTAIIEQDKCIACGRCMEVCRFDAVRNDWEYCIDPQMCEGCLSCTHQCPVDAIRVEERKSGDWFRSNTPYGTLYHASLIPGEENSGKLVSELIDQTQNEGESEGAELMIVDGPPGVGCPVTAACRSTDFVVLVSEPTVSGQHDLERVLQLTQYFKLPVALVLNKATLSEKLREGMLSFAQKEDIDVFGEIPYDESAMQALFSAKPLTRQPEHALKAPMESIWAQLKKKVE